MEKAKFGISASPTKAAETSNQVLSLVEALTHAKKELDAQGARMKALEDMLQQERLARESAEEKARRLEAQNRFNGNGSVVDHTFESLESASNQSDGVHKSEEEHDLPESRTWQATKTPEELSQDTANASASAARLQQRVELMVAEMDEMKQQMEKYKRRAETAEEESVSSRKTLAEMVEKIRRDGATAATAEADTLSHRVRTEIATQTDTGFGTELPDSSRSGASLLKKAGVENGKPIGPGELAQLEKAMATALAQSSGPGSTERLHASAPFASMLGVVLIGVGLMAYLNGWQKVER